MLPVHNAPSLGCKGGTSLSGAVFAMCFHFSVLGCKGSVTLCSGVTTPPAMGLSHHSIEELGNSFGPGWHFDKGTNKRVSDRF